SPFRVRQIPTAHEASLTPTPRSRQEIRETAPKAVDALIVAYDIDGQVGKWSTAREAVHELATRMGESTETVMGAAPPMEVLDLLAQATEREPVRGRAALAAYCTHLSLTHLARRDLDHHHVLEVVERAVKLYSDLVPSDVRWFRPFAAIASADAAEVFYAAGSTDDAIECLRFAIATFREHGWDVFWWRTDLVRHQVELARSFIALHRMSDGTYVVHEMLADIDQYFAGSGEQLPADLGIAVNELRDWAEGLDSANRPADEGPR
ncbi:hypothetical protein ACIO93_43700, partial [Streptomyces sp. NPDC087903]|uniref:hypothetical protein n=1 Tax=Streptomyces sp. NPDC087903 TaxID=3365819 RepID=UPI0037F6074F